MELCAGETWTVKGSNARKAARESSRHRAAESRPAEHSATSKAYSFACCCCKKEEEGTQYGTWPEAGPPEQGYTIFNADSLLQGQPR